MNMQRVTLVVAALLGATLAASTPALAADANAGKKTFRAQCALCHSAEPNDNGGAQGPNLSDLIGRPAASAPGFSYTDAMKRSHLKWDAATLDRFLSSPTTVVPGSAMVIALPNKEDRENVIAYFTALKNGTFKDEEPPRRGPPPGMTPPASAGAAHGAADWKNDKPGRVHRIDVANLPPPFATPSAANFPRLVEKPANAKLSLPPGFTVNVFAKDLTGPRAMRVAPNGDIFISETQAGRVKVMRPSADGASAASVTTFAQGLLQPFGIRFYPENGQPQWLYVAETNRVVRYAYTVGDTQASGVPEVVVPQLAPSGGGHFTRDIAFSPDGKRMFVSVGSQSNVAEQMPKKTPEEIKAWEAQHGLGAAWGAEENRADVLVFEVGSKNPGKVFATGIRNCVGLTVQPQTGDLWCTTNERDLLGDDLVPDYSTRVKEGGFYGWPWYYMGKYEDPRLKGDRPDLAGKAIVPDVPYQAHSAALNLAFYTATSGKAAFPKEYVGDGFAVLHGSWNRAFRTGHKVVRVRMKNNVPTGEYEDFMVGFITDDGNAWGRPVGAAVARDGSLLISDDGGNVVYRIAYENGSNAAR
ncbi:MAG TPA: PQQ-dependent sugar dehydrogenase [Steroidobacteraceae bacterium]|jgi:glucose/arabinose dehydrogenase/cytochrome c2|nr:PQQ-dependent sugar dehydrogenase [Steroidobacteraceae bacterium]